MSDNPISVDLIVATVATVTEIPRAALLSPRRTYRIAQARFAIYWLARELTQMSSGAIGRALGDRDHSTVLVGIQRAEAQRARDADFRRETDALKVTLLGLQRAGILKLVEASDPLATARRILAAPEREAPRVSVVDTVAMAQLVVELLGDDEPAPSPSSEQMEHSDAA